MPKKYRQQKFGFMKSAPLEFGGELLTGKRKIARPISPLAVTHLILKSHSRSLFNPCHLSVELLIRQVALRFRVKILDLALNWNHSHLAIRAKSKRDYNSFVRVLTSFLAVKLAASGENVEEKRVFPFRPYTRIVSYGRDLKNLFSYFQKNRDQASRVGTREQSEIKTKPSVANKAARARKASASESTILEPDFLMTLRN